MHACLTLSLSSLPSSHAISSSTRLVRRCNSRIDPNPSPVVHVQNFLPSQKSTVRKTTLILYATVLGILISFMAANIVAGLCFQSRWMIKTAESRWPRVLFSFPEEDAKLVGEKVVVLTIDDAISGKRTELLLDILQEFNATATFFVMGNTLDRNPYNRGILHRMRAQGCEAGHHMWQDEPTVNLNQDELKIQLEEVDKLLFNDESPKPPFRWFRPGSGWFNNDVLDAVEAKGYHCVLGDIHPFDAQIKKSGFISWFVKGRLHPGGIIILHDRDYTVSSLRDIMKSSVRQGWKFVSLSNYCHLLQSNRLSIPRSVSPVSTTPMSHGTPVSNATPMTTATPTSQSYHEDDVGENILSVPL